MNDAGAAHPVETDVLAGILGNVLVSEGHIAVRPVRVERRPCPFASSFPLEELTIKLQDGTELELLFKDTSPMALPAETRSLRPAFLEDPLREIATYRRLLAHAPTGAPLYYGCHIDEVSGRYWLFLEKVHGRALSMVGDYESWNLTARHLARLHDHLSRSAQTDRIACRLIRHDRAYYANWLRRAMHFSSENRTDQSPPPEPLQRLAEIHSRILDDLLTQTAAVIHGELYAPNILIGDSKDGIRICPVDWERTAIGPALMDVAALTGGNWSEERKQEMLEIYRTERQQLGHRMPESGDLRRQFDLCRIQLAVQWLGWSSNCARRLSTGKTGLQRPSMRHVVVDTPFLA